MDPPQRHRLPGEGPSLWHPSEAGGVRVSLQERCPPPDPRAGQVWADAGWRVLTRWHSRQPCAGQRRLVLVVSEVCARGYRAGRAREGRTRSEERPVGWSAAGAAVGGFKQAPRLPTQRPFCWWG